MPRARDIADYFLSKTVDEEDAKITNLKLQKLLYYAQGFYLALYHEALYDEAIEAWMHGPVCVEIYHDFKANGANIISYNDCDKNFNEILTTNQIELLDEVYNLFGQFSGWKLRDMTHNEPTWINNKDCAAEISKEEMEEYFITRIS